MAPARAAALAGLRISAAGDSGVLIRFGDEISEAIFQRVMAALAALEAARPGGVVDLMPAYASVLVVFDPVGIAPRKVRAWIESTLATAPVAAPTAGRTVAIPVLYHPRVAPDLDSLAAEKGWTPGELIRRHTAPRYRCHLLGFRPGFPFLGGLDPELHTPRLATPRPVVEAGSVAVAGRQTGIYPGRGPGGWRIVGRTPLTLFDRRRPQPFLVQAGDHVTFVPIDEARFAVLLAEASAGAPA